MSQLHFIQFANLALHLSGRAKSLNNANVFDKVFNFFFALFYVSLLAFVVSFVIFRGRSFHLFSHGVYGRRT